MNAKTQYQMSSSDLELLLALVRGGTLNAAAELLSVDTSTVFRALQKLEKALGLRLFIRSRQGYRASELALQLSVQAEQMEVALESARSLLQHEPSTVAGRVRITTTDTILHGLLAPALAQLSALHPLLSFEIKTSNELANLTRHDADIALRATKRPPAHLIGKKIGAIQVAVYSAKHSDFNALDDAKNAPWIAPDEALPTHPSVSWRKKHLPKITPTYTVDSILSVAELSAQNVGIGIVPHFLAQARHDLKALTPTLNECETELWLLTHAESRHLLRVATVYSFLAQHIRL